MATKLPYKKIGIVMSGLPLNKQLKHPSSYGRLTLQEILDNKDNIKVQDINNLVYHKICDYFGASLRSEKSSASF